jgi:hypothetical protein
MSWLLWGRFAGLTDLGAVAPAGRFLRSCNLTLGQAAITARSATLLTGIASLNPSPISAQKASLTVYPSRLVHLHDGFCTL